MAFLGLGYFRCDGFDLGCYADGGVEHVRVAEYIHT